MGSKIKRKSCLTNHPPEIFLLILFFLTVNLFILSHYQEKSLKTLQNAEIPVRGNSSDCLQSYNQQTLERGTETQILTIEEDGRFGNLLMETATLLIVGNRLNTSVRILPQVAVKMSQFLSSLPAPSIDCREVRWRRDVSSVRTFHCRPVSVPTARTACVLHVTSGPRSPLGSSWPTRPTSPT